VERKIGRIRFVKRYCIVLGLTLCTASVLAQQRAPAYAAQSAGVTINASENLCRQKLIQKLTGPPDYYYLVASDNHTLLFWRGGHHTQERLLFTTQERGNRTVVRCKGRGTVKGEHSNPIPAWWALRKATEAFK
jgi:hypothetical protein